MCQLYAWRHKETKKRRFTKVFIECSRKQARFGHLYRNI